MCVDVIWRNQCSKPNCWEQRNVIFLHMWKGQVFSEDLLRIYSVKKYSKSYKSDFLCLLPQNIPTNQTRRPVLTKSFSTYQPLATPSLTFSSFLVTSKPKFGQDTFRLKAPWGLSTFWMEWVLKKNWIEWMNQRFLHRGSKAGCNLHISLVDPEF